MDVWRGRELSYRYPEKAQLTIVSRRMELERHFESEILLLCRPDINVLDGAWTTDDRFELHSVDERFPQSNILDAGVVKAIHIVPVCSDERITHRLSIN